MAAEEIDSALMAALRDPRERMGLLKLEQAMCEFLQSETDGWMEVGGPFNSQIQWPSASNNSVSYPPTMRQTTFQRCILHRLADRFHIIREAGSVLPSSIRLIKIPESKIPAQLLQKYPVTAAPTDPDHLAFTAADRSTTP